MPMRDRVVVMDDGRVVHDGPWDVAMLGSPTAPRWTVTRDPATSRRTTDAGDEATRSSWARRYRASTVDGAAEARPALRAGLEFLQYDFMQRALLAALLVGLAAPVVGSLPRAAAARADRRRAWATSR